MIASMQVDSSLSPDGTEIVLVRRGEQFTIRAGGFELMSSRAHGSEDALARLGCAHCGNGARILIGGLGLGFTLRAALDNAPRDASVDVCELIPAVVRWNHEHLGHLANFPLRDRRVCVHVTDVCRFIFQATAASYDTILLDIDNGPAPLTDSGNARLYRSETLNHLYKVLRPGGTLAIWSADADARFERRVRAAGFDLERHRVAAFGHAGPMHTVWLASKRAEAAQ